MSIGLTLLLLYFLLYESMCANQWIPLSITVLLIAILITAVFRMLNAKWVIEKCKKINPNILTGYIENALSQAEYDKLEDGTFSGRIPSCKGVIAFGKTLRECKS